MPANLTPQFHDAEERFKAAENLEQKVAALEEMLRVIPKHKGTEKLQADLKSRLAKLRRSHQKEKASGGPRRPFHYVEREGIGRVVVCGPANSGKSDLVGRLTNAHAEVANYPFTTRAPLPGMMQFEDVQIQLVDTPPLAHEILEPWQLAMIEQADLVVLLFDMSDPDLLDQTDFVLGHLADRSIALQPREQSKVLVFGNKMDLPGARENFQAWIELFQDSFEAEPFSVHSEADLLHLKRILFDRLRVVRVYTKPPGSRLDKNQTPFVLPQGSTVLDATAAIHKDLVRTLKFARIWGEDKFDGQMVERDYILHDGDILELHA